MSIRLGRNAIVVVIASLATALLGIVPASALAGFGDVGPDEFYSEPVQWFADSGITNGISPGCFGPGHGATRGEVATFLHRYAGRPGAGSEPFTDVKPGDFFAEPVAWMVSAGITTGATDTTFAPQRNVTRGEVAAFLHRFVGQPDGGAEPFSDVNPTDFFAGAVAWMVSTGVTTGTSATTFDPHRPVTRGELATFLYRVDGSPRVTLSDGGVCGETTEANSLSVAEAVSWALLNDVRIDAGLPSLTRDSAMDSFARSWSNTMADSADFTHSSGPYAENIAWWSAASASPEEAAERLHGLWVNSPGHFRNMTRANVTEVGIGFWQSADGWHATHVFG